jgi:hypothetical protein
LKFVSDNVCAMRGQQAGMHGGAKRSFGAAAVGVGLWGDSERSIWRLGAKAGVPVEWD